MSHYDQVTVPNWAAAWDPKILFFGFLKEIAKATKWLIVGVTPILSSLPGDINFALSRPATQSSTFLGAGSNWEASRAVDGDTTTSSATDDGDFKPWWKVQLVYPIWVTHVEITCHGTNTCEYSYIQVPHFPHILCFVNTSWINPMHWSSSVCRRSLQMLQFGAACLHSIIWGFRKQQGSYAIEDIGPKLILNSNLVKYRLLITYFSFTQFWNLSWKGGETWQYIYTNTHLHRYCVV